VALVPVIDAAARPLWLPGRRRGLRREVALADYLHAEGAAALPHHRRTSGAH